MSDKISPVNCLRFAEEFLALAKVEPARGSPILDLLGQLGAAKVLVKKGDLHPAQMEFFGREMTDEEREQFSVGIGAFTAAEIKHRCSMFELAHIVYHIMNGFEGSEHD